MGDPVVRIVVLSINFGAPSLRLFPSDFLSGSSQLCLLRSTGQASRASKPTGASEDLSPLMASVVRGEMQLARTGAAESLKSKS